MKKILNIILNQLGFIVVVISSGLVYYGYTRLTWEFVLMVGTVLFIIFIASQMTYKSLVRGRMRRGI